jgi:ferredoxin-NADP reductase
MKFTGKISNVKKQTPDIVTLRIETPKDFDFIPGQFVNAIAKVDGKNVARSYTISSAPHEKFLEITVKKQGLFSSYLHSLKKGDELQMMGPVGNFRYEDSDKEAVFIIGGCGIGAAISMLRHIAHKEKKKCYLFYSCRTFDDAAFKEELDSYEKKGMLKQIITLTRSEKKGCEIGRVNETLLNKYLKDIPKKVFYLCGPVVMVQDVVKMLENLGVPKENIKVERW